MVDRNRVPLRLGDTDGSASEIASFVHGTLTPTFGAVAAAAVVSASAAPVINGNGYILSTSHKLVIMQEAATSAQRLPIVGADVTAENVVTMTAGNPGPSAATPGATTYSFFAWK
jgi:hypothetical protein